MKYIDEQKLLSASADAFKGQIPFPFSVIEGLLTPWGYQRLVSQLPDPKHFEKPGHSRLQLEFENLSSPNIIPQPWREFISELQSPKYKEFLKRMYAHPYIGVRYHWYYAFDGYVIPPHCDHPGKLGSHIFYLNTDSDWQKEWGGGTVVLSPLKVGEVYSPETDHKKEYSDFNLVNVSGPIGNVSMMFERTENSWHGMQKVSCPEGRSRNVFIIVIDRMNWRSYMADKYPVIGRLKGAVQKALGLSRGSRGMPNGSTSY